MTTSRMISGEESNQRNGSGAVSGLAIFADNRGPVSPR